jgi:acetyl-CoA acetyltransferase
MSGAIEAHLAFMAIASGMHDTVLAVGGEKAEDGGHYDY